MVRSKRNRVSDKRKKKKSAKKNLKRKYMSNEGKSKRNEAAKNRRKNHNEVIAEQCSGVSRNCVGEFRVSDRKFVEENARKYEAAQHSYGKSNMVDLYGEKLKDIKWRQCKECHTRILGISPTCWCSKSYIMNSRLMNIGSVPEVLNRLSLMEQLAISIVKPVVQVYRLKGGQCGYKGHVVNFFQDVQSFAKKLPHSVADMKGYIYVSYDSLLFHKDFKLRKVYLLEALQFLIKFNPYFKHIKIDECALNSFPEDGFYHGKTEDMSSVDEGNVLLEDEEKVTSSTVPSVHLYSSDVKVKHTLDWPTVSSVPINELTCKGYIAQAFPCLFPFGEGDLYDVQSKHLTPRVYFQYLMDYEDGRFASHSIFPYFALNTVMRWECLSKGTVYMKEHPDLKKVNLQLLKDILKEKPDIMKDMLVYGSNIRGTREFWSARSSDLQSLCDFCGLPTIFFSYSAADFRWPRLRELILEKFNIANATDKEYFKVLLANPKISSDYFYEVFTMFFHDIMLGAYEIVDFWYRYEWQSRGSPHIHGVMWLRNAVDVSRISERLEQVEQSVISYFDKFISCSTPNADYVDVGAHPCSVKIEEIGDRKEDLAALINSVQMHECSARCKTKSEKCKYGFPKPLLEKSMIVLNKRQYYEFEGMRNHPFINKHNSESLEAWRANSDWTPVLSDKGFRQYIAKYASKAEVKSRSLMEIFSDVLDHADGNKGVKSSVQRALMCALVERDYSGQEVHHLLSGKKLYSCSRSFVKVNMKSSEWKYHLDLDGNGEVKDNFNHVFHCYSKRTMSLDKVSLLTFVQMYNIDTCNVRRRKCIPVIYPRLKYSGEDVNSVEIARQLVLLHVPWRHFDQLPANDESWIEWMSVHKLNVEMLPYFSIKSGNETLNLNIGNETDSSSDEMCTEEEEKGKDDWMCVIGSSVGSSECKSDGTHVESQSYDMKSCECNEEDGVLFDNFLKNVKDSGIERSVSSCLDRYVLSEDQKDVLNVVSAIISSIKDGCKISNVPQLVLCQGVAGCGKTLLISEIEFMMVSEFGLGSVLILAFTGASALNARGKTIHSVLRIPFGNRKEMCDLKGESLQKFQEQMKNVKMVIIEEFSMVGCYLFNSINKRCMQMKNNQEVFGGLPVFLFGDIHQLPPVGDTPLYSLNVSSTKLRAYPGNVLFRSMVKPKFLTVHHRQNDPYFVKFLDNLSIGQLDSDDCEYISDRFESSMNEAEIGSFHDGVHLFQYCEEVDLHNQMKLKNIGKPILKIIAENNNEYAKASSDDNASHLQNELEVCVDARVMLRVNLWTEAGLVNGAVGTLVDIVYCESIYEDQISFLLIKFDNYVGPTLDNGCVPIKRVLRSWDVNDVYCSRFQFPISLAYAITVHKSQGLTLEKIVVHFHKREMMAGIFYVALSRVREKSHIMISGSAENSPLFCMKRSIYAGRIAAKEWLLSIAF